VTVTNAPTLCQAQLVDSGSGPGTVTFQFHASDSLGTGNTATVTVNIGTPPVDEPLTQTVNGGQLVLSCSNPDTNGGTPALTCPEFQFAPITLNGLEQTTTGAGSTLYVSDNRGDPTAGWDLSAFMVATPIGAGSNTNSSCSGIVAFCNADVGSHALDASGNGQIAKGNLSIGSITCTPHGGNLRSWWHVRRDAAHLLGARHEERRYLRRDEVVHVDDPVVGVRRQVLGDRGVPRPVVG
jgi:hypothetical protein